MLTIYKMSDPKNSKSVEDEIDDDPVDNNIEVIEANEDQNDEGMNLNLI